MYNTDLYKRIRAEVDKIALIDTHEHLSFPHQLAEMKRIDFGRLFLHYASSDLRSAGMPEQDIAEVQNMDSKLSPKEKWQLLKPWYEKAWNTGHCEALRIAVRDLYEIEDLADDTVEPLSEKMNNVPRESWTRDVFDRAAIEIAMEQTLDTDPVYPGRRYPELFLYDMSDPFSRLETGRLAQDSGISIETLGDYLKVIDYYFDKFADEASAFKVGRAYDRTLSFDDVPCAEAGRIFGRFISRHDGPTREEVKALEDFVIHYCVGRAGEHNLPVKFHTGLQEGNANDIKNSRAALLVNLFMKYPNTKFDIYHISWPYAEELLDICKNFPNVWVDFCWAWIFNPPASRRFLADMLETIPLNKIHGFGGDFIFVEGSYGHSVIARREIARVLADKVEEGRFTEEYAIWAARRILRENALENFRVEEKRKLIAERNGDS